MVDKAGMIDALTRFLDQKSVMVEPEFTARYALDGVEPKAVLFPANTKQVADVVKYANKENLSILPWGSGTKMGMGFAPSQLDLVVCTSRLDHMTDVDAANLTITAEAGVRFRDIQARLATQEDRCYLPLGDLGTEEDELICSDRSHSGCFLPIDPPSCNKATIGGVIACNSSGPKRLLYGLPRDIVLGTRFVTPDGDIVGAGGKTVKNVSGYDISKLMIGSMGTLGILCEMTLRLLPLPESMETLILSFDHLDHASSFVDRVFKTRMLPAAVDLMNRTALKNTSAGREFQNGSSDYAVVIALEAFEEAVKRMHAEILDLAAAHGMKSEVCIQEEEHLRFWLEVSHLLSNEKKSGEKQLTIQMNYPLSKWQAITESSVNVMTGLDRHYNLLVHAGSGVGLLGFPVSGDNPSENTAVTQTVKTLLGQCREAGGSIFIPDAPSDLKPALPIWGETGADLMVMKKIKDKVDPGNIMSPGRFMTDQP